MDLGEIGFNWLRTGFNGEWSFVDTGEAPGSIIVRNLLIS
jgi:hypothetical protein